MTTRTQVKALTRQQSIVEEAEDLLTITRGCRPDMHDADLYLRAEVSGRVLNNAGTANELAVRFEREDDRGDMTIQTGHEIPLATLTALARVGAAALLEEAGHVTA